MYTVILKSGLVVILLTSRIRSEVMKEILNMEGLSVVYQDDKPVYISFGGTKIKDFSDNDSDCDWYYTSEELRVLNEVWDIEL